MSENPIRDLEPWRLWSHFVDLSAIPRPSKHEQRVSQWLKSTAREWGWDCVEDAAGNLVIRIPASKGREKAPIVILQAHTDMVCEKNEGVSHDFMQDPLTLQLEDGWVKATDTTLGADNGIGLCAALAAATDESVDHGPLELLFTCDEETGLNGAKALDGSMLAGRLLLNLDSDRHGTLLIGCAGSVDGSIRRPLEREQPGAGSSSFTVRVTGLAGGHSGGDIHEARGNAIKVLAACLRALEQKGIDHRLVDVRGGSKRNALAREASAVIRIDSAVESSVREILAATREAQNATIDGDGLVIELADGSEGQPLTESSATAVLSLLEGLPHGVISMSSVIDGLVQTSTNLAVVETDADELKIVTSTRSSDNDELEQIKARLGRLAADSGATFETPSGYPAWQPDTQSELVNVVRRSSETLFGAEPNVTAIHAGLECALLGGKLPGVEMVSFGPNIEGAHSPTERVEVASVGKFWNLLRETLDQLSSSSQR